MHALVPAVVLGASGPAALMDDAEAHPPDVQVGEAAPLMAPVVVSTVRRGFASSESVATRGRDHLARVLPVALRAMEHVSRSTRLIARLDLTSLATRFIRFSSFGSPFGSRSRRVGAFAAPWRTAMVIESLCASMPR